jgi:hypothetical protein
MSLPNLPPGASIVFSFWISIIGLDVFWSMMRLSRCKIGFIWRFVYRGATGEIGMGVCLAVVSLGFEPGWALCMSFRWLKLTLRWVGIGDRAWTGVHSQHLRD